MALCSSADMIYVSPSADPCNEAIISPKLHPAHHANRVFSGLLTQLPRIRILGSSLGKFRERSMQGIRSLLLTCMLRSLKIAGAPNAQGLAANGRSQP